MVETATRGRLYTMKTLTDRRVVNKQGEKLGEIQDFVMDTSRGCISYAVLSFSSGFLNMNRKYFAVPWEAFGIDEAHRDLVLDVDEERLKNSPGFDRDEWPSEPDDTFARGLYEHYGYQYPPRGNMGGGGGDYEQSRGEGGYSSGQGYGTAEGEGRGEGGSSSGRGPLGRGREGGDEPNRW